MYTDPLARLDNVINNSNTVQVTDVSKKLDALKICQDIKKRK